ncbi:hypothetical protein HER10_EVM0005982 [Colletotrichum scovillei]|uniref:Allantoin permease n=1 Tax=Colletotrichum scovillei TaxID=1209932 RepID=A0A9P7RHR1_9PEZI|nr:uncharacterized protein HER10_EVM0005982 [Colletotrichum scovillei]KAF4779705.1 hypothetical protein HER10_EVM0005982 [Colletotrichum scovillei]KAG7057418.1 allantoin permease [Colletotrichum scovillei]KAG7076044.1 allantoin permease [Colletotrichum scovillei]KAG7083132.1 allantoin permease [Colletotrichum scovillei]
MAPPFLSRPEIQRLVSDFLVDFYNREDVENWEDVQRATIDAMGDIIVQLARAQAEGTHPSPDPMDLDDGGAVQPEEPDSDDTSDPDDFVRDDIPPQALRKNSSSSDSDFEGSGKKNPRSGKGAIKTKDTPRKDTKVKSDRVASLEARKTNKCVLGCGLGYTTTDRLKRHYKSHHPGWETAVVAAGQTIFANQRGYKK